MMIAWTGVAGEKREEEVDAKAIWEVSFVFSLHEYEGCIQHGTLWKPWAF